MNKSKIVLSALPAAIMMAAGSPAMAAKDPVTIRHCGCDDTGTALRYVDIVISSRGCKGHRNHDPSTVDTCDPGGDIVRTNGDCRVSGSTSGFCGTIPTCGGQAVGQLCSAAP